jgi:hypothetical protein
MRLSKLESLEKQGNIKDFHSGHLGWVLRLNGGNGLSLFLEVNSAIFHSMSCHHEAAAFNICSASIKSCLFTLLFQESFGRGAVRCYKKIYITKAFGSKYPARLTSSYFVNSLDDSEAWLLQVRDS